MGEGALGVFHLIPLHERAVIETFGRFSRVKGPGLVVLVPVLQTLKRVDLREQQVELRTATVRYAIEDPAKALYNVADYRAAMETLAGTMLKRELDARPLGALVIERAAIEEVVRKELEATAGAWGIRIVKVEVLPS